MNTPTTFSCRSCRSAAWLLAVRLRAGALWLVAAVVSASMGHSATLVERYWPANDGDVKYYAAGALKAYITCENALDAACFRMVAFEYDPDYDDYYESFSVSMCRSGGGLWEQCVDFGWRSVCWHPSIEVLTEGLLANGGSKKFSSSVTISGTTVPVSGVVTVKKSGVVVVPAGKFNDCRTLSVTARARVDGKVVTMGTEAYTLAPGVGQIRIGMATPRGMRWMNLTHGTVGGRDVRDYANQVPPKVKIAYPLPNKPVTSGACLVQGSASDNVGVARVWCAVNDSPWQLAQTSNGWMIWSAPIQLRPGVNSIRAYGEDNMGNPSRVAELSCKYIVTAPLSATASPSDWGSLRPNLNGSLLEIGTRHSMEAVAAKGFRFDHWSGSVAGTRARIAFTMASNLTLVAHFRDVKRPNNGITHPAAGQRISGETVTVTGKSRDNVGVAVVWYRLNNGNWNSASSADNFSNWSTGPLAVNVGPNVVEAWAADAAGLRSRTNRIRFTRN